MLPKPSSTFEWIELPGGPALVCRALAAVAPHFFTTRISWPLGSGQSTDGWTPVAIAAGVGPQHLVRLRQTHGADSISVRDGLRFATPPAGDILVSDDVDAAIAVQAADCVPILVADRRLGVAAAAHAGWRGLLAGVPHVAVRALGTEFGSRPSDLVAAIGPSIGACCYEVGNDVRNQFDTAFAGAAPGWFFESPVHDPGNPPFRALQPSAGKSFFDGWRAASDQLEEAGVPRGSIHVARLCTASHAELCSYRRDGAAAGRIAAVITARRAG